MNEIALNIHRKITRIQESIDRQAKMDREIERLQRKIARIERNKIYEKKILSYIKKGQTEIGAMFSARYAANVSHLASQPNSLLSRVKQKHSFAGGTFPVPRRG